MNSATLRTQAWLLHGITLYGCEVSQLELVDGRVVFAKGERE
jgi:hypothetical protein